MILIQIWDEFFQSAPQGSKHRVSCTPNNRNTNISHNVCTPVLFPNIIINNRLLLGND